MKKKAFTLAEVLITLSILGVVAAIMIPSTVKNIKNRLAITQLKRTYSIVNNALNQMFIIEGYPETWNDIPSTAGAYNRNRSNYLGEKMAKYLPVQKYCGSTNDCFTKTEKFKTLKGDKEFIFYSAFGRTLLKNGAAVAYNFKILPNSNDYQYNGLGYLGAVYIDINGTKAPNRKGYDIFTFNIGKEGILTKNAKWTYQQQDIAQNCSITLSSDYESSDGDSCGRWIMKHNNMDYKYRDVSAEW